MNERFWYRVTRKMLKAGPFPTIVRDEHIKIVKEYASEDEAKFLSQLKPRQFYEYDDLKSITGLDDESFKIQFDNVLKKALMTEIPHEFKPGTNVYFITSLYPGLLEFIFMKNDVSQTVKNLASIQEELVKKMIANTQENYDNLLPIFKSMPVFGRTIPVEKFVETKEEVVLPFQEVSKIIEGKEIIGVGNCFCRHAKDILGHHCKRTDLRRTCFFFDDIGKFLIKQGFIEQVPQEEAIKILRDCEEAGLVHKVFSKDTDKHIDREVINAMCNCCADCCEILGGHMKGGIPLIDLTEYMAQVNVDECVGCGNCVEKCNLSIIELVDDIAVVEQDKCIGCGACAYTCPTGAMNLIKTELRRVFTPPPRIGSV